MCEDQRTLCHLLLGLDDTHIDTLISRLNTHILPSDTFLESLSLEHASTVKRACLIIFALTRRIILKEWQLASTLDILAGRDTILNTSTGAGKNNAHSPSEPSQARLYFRHHLTSEAPDVISGCRTQSLRSANGNRQRGHLPRPKTLRCDSQRTLRPHSYISRTITTTPGSFYSFLPP